MKTPNCHRSAFASHLVMTRARYTHLVTLILALIAAVDMQAQKDDFNDGDDLGWLQYDPLGSQVGVPQNIWSFPSGKYRLQAAPTPNPAGGPGRVGSLRQDVSFSSFHLEVDLVDWVPTRTNAFGLIARVHPSRHA